jgi:hypothetical protein
MTLARSFYQFKEKRLQGNPAGIVTVQSYHVKD